MGTRIPPAAQEVAMIPSEPVDYLVLAPLKIERDALLDAFGATPSGIRIGSAGAALHLAVANRQRGCPANVVVAHLDKPGTLFACAAATRLIPLVKPWCVVSFGLAGGIAKYGVDIGSVVVAESVIYYEPAEEDGPALPQDSNLGRNPRLEPFKCSKPLVDTCRRVRDRMDRQFQDHIVFGSVGSGEKVVAHVDALTSLVLKRFNQQVKCIENEAAGVAMAAENAQADYPIAFVAIKGVSDRADANRGNNYHENQRLAVGRAAGFFRQLVQEPTFEVRRDERLLSVHSRAKRIQSSLPAHLVEPPTVSEIANAIYPPDAPTTVFYHWRMQERLHWVDMCLLLVVRSLAQEGLRPCPIITPLVSAGATQAWRESIHGIVSCITTAAPQWSDQLPVDDYVLERYAREHGISEDDERHVLAWEGDGLRPREWNAANVRLLRFIVWKTWTVEQAFVLRWKKHEELYRLLKNTLPRRIAFLQTKDLQLGGELGKSGAIGRHLFIEPPEYESMLDWLDGASPVATETGYARVIDRTPTAQIVAEISGHLWLGRQPSVDPVEVSKSQLVRNRDAIRKRLVSESNDPWTIAAAQLVQLFDKWNASVFGSLIQRSTGRG